MATRLQWLHGAMDCSGYMTAMGRLFERARRVQVELCRQGGASILNDNVLITVMKGGAT